jgi:LuxR family maltose regulon positive regulatory protein
MLPVLATKLHIPRAHPNRISRLHLNQRLDEGLWHTRGVDFMRRLTLVAAPAGYGKTTLLCEWLKHLEIPVAWITFDEADNDPGRFLQYIIVALQTIQPGIGESVLAVLQSPQLTINQLRISNLMIALVNEIAEIPHACFLVFDDYHTLEDQGIHQAVTFLLDHMPEKISLVIATRADPPLLLTRLRARRQLLEVRSDDLRFSEGEAAAFLQQVMNLGLQDQEVEILVNRTEGWIAGLQMAALALQEHSDPARFIRDFSGRERFVIDYLFEEVLCRQPGYIQTFLLQTSILEGMTGPLCDAVLEKQESEEASFPPEQDFSPPSGQQILEHLDRTNLFLVPLDNERCYYRYHHLFADLLRHRLHRSFPDLVPSLHSRAAEWFEKQGSISDALDHRIAALDFNHATRLVEKYGYTFFYQGNFHQMLVWLQKIPKEIILAQSWLCIIYSWVLVFTGKISEGKFYLEAAQTSLSSSDETTSPRIMRQFGQIAAINEYLCTFNLNTAGIIHYANQALQYLPPDDLPIRCMVEYSLSTAILLTDEVTLAEESLLKAASLGKESGNTLIAVGALCTLAQVCVRRGELHRALSIFQEAANLAKDERGRSLPVVSEIYMGMGGLYFEWNDLNTSEKDLLAALEIGTLYSNTDLIIISLGFLSRVRIAQGDLDAAECLLNEINNIDKQKGRDLGISILVFWLRYHLAKGDLAMASRLVKQQDWQLEGKSIYAWSIAFITYSKFLYLQGRCKEAYTLLEECLVKLRSCGLELPIIRALIIQASISDSQGEHALANDKIEEALSLAEAEGYIRTFVDEGEPIRSLLTHIRTKIVQKSRVDDPTYLHRLSYVDQLLSAFHSPASEKTIKPSSVNLTPLILVDQLTEREVEVLQLIAAGLSNKEIAEKLFLSVGTVKAHTSSIYRKLDVPGRTRALAKAREIHVI